MTIFDYVGWPETMVGSCHQLAKPEKEGILTKPNAPAHFDPAYRPFGDGHSAGKIVERIQSFLKDGETP